MRFFQLAGCIPAMLVKKKQKKIAVTKKREFLNSLIFCLIALLGGGRFSRSVGRTLRGGMWGSKIAFGNNRSSEAR